MEDPEVYAVMKSYSPYDNVRSLDQQGMPLRYPDILATAGLSDPRVGFWDRPSGRRSFELPILRTASCSRPSWERAMEARQEGMTPGEMRRSSTPSSSTLWASTAEGPLWLHLPVMHLLRHGPTVYWPSNLTRSGSRRRGGGRSRGSGRSCGCSRGARSEGRLEGHVQRIGQGNRLPLRVTVAPVAPSSRLILRSPEWSGSVPFGSCPSTRCYLNQWIGPGPRWARWLWPPQPGSSSSGPGRWRWCRCWPPQRSERGWWVAWSSSVCLGLWALGCDGVVWTAAVA